MVKNCQNVVKPKYITGADPENFSGGGGSNLKKKPITHS